MVGTVIWRATGDYDGVEDLAQETFMRVFRGLPYFAARAKLSTWICTVAHRVAIDHLRGAARRREDSATLLSGEGGGTLFDKLAAPGDNPEGAAIRNQTDRLVHKALLQLPDRYRLPLVYASIDGIDYGTIAAMLDLPVGTVKTLVFRGKQLLREQIAAGVEDPDTRREV
jgi:RNA polymerase sigma-70 factor, ECF subfamily